MLLYLSHGSNTNTLTSLIAATQLPTPPPCQQVSFLFLPLGLKPSSLLPCSLLCPTVPSPRAENYHHTLSSLTGSIHTKRQAASVNYELYVPLEWFYTVAFEAYYCPRMWEGNVFILSVCLSVCSGYNF